MVELDILHTIMSDDTQTQTPMQEINDAYKACGFGRFHVRLMFITFVGSVAGVLVTSTTSFVLPEAECDLHLSLVDKGLLISAPYFAMLLFAMLAGLLADTFGRKMFLKIGYGGIFFFTVIAGTSQSYEVLLTAKFFEGALFATSISSHLVFTSEFCHKDIRDRVMLCQLSFVAVTQIINPLLTWSILIQDWRFSLFDGYFVLNTWNFYLYIISLWSLFACIFYSTLPESPKYLVTRQNYDEAREILVKIYEENTGKSGETYPFKDIWKNVRKHDEMQTELKLTSITHRLVVGLHGIKPMFRKPLLFHLIILSGSMFLILAIYNLVRLWFPQLSTIVEHYKTDLNQNFCVLLDSYTSDLKSRGNSTSDICVPIKSGAQSYINSVIVGFVCLFPYFVSGAVVTKVGKKALLVTCGIASGGITLGLRWASSKSAVVALFAAVTALMQLMKGISQTAAVELFPTAIRSLAISMVSTCGRLGTLASNIGFPVLLDFGCIVPFFTMAGMMFCVSILALFMPKKKL